MGKKFEMKIDKSGAPLDMFIKPQPKKEEQLPFREPPIGTGKEYKVICTNLRKELLSALEYIARYDRKAKNAVISEALEAYVKNWVPTTEAPKTAAELLNEQSE